MNPSTFQRVGLVVNQAAGRSPRQAAETAHAALKAIGARAVVTGPGALGADPAGDGSFDLTVAPVAGSGREATRALARALLASGLDVVVVIGGDGTMADVASEFCARAGHPALLGIGTGSANAGTLVTCRAAQAGGLAAAALSSHRVSALRVSVGQVSALAFNDIVIANTIVGTRGDQLVDLDARAVLTGGDGLGKPASIATDSAIVTIRRGEDAMTLARGGMVATVIVGFAERSFFAKAIVGGACLAAMTGLPAGCLVADRPLACVGVSAPQLLAAGPLNTSFVPLDDASRIEVRGLAGEAVVAADGNPLASASDETQIDIAFLPDAINALTLKAAS